MFSNLTKVNFYLNLFAFTKVPLIWLCRPKIIEIDQEKVVVKIPLKRRTKNHLNSMYFGVLAVGADVAGGFLAMSKAKENNKKISLAFKQVEGRFLKRPEADVIFTCTDGKLIDEILQQSSETGERVNRPVRIVATCPSINGDEPMAEFDLMLSVKTLS
ncbi:PaaI family thioesterase [Vibrio sp. SCSIO 43137]|uniref:PaaI family thioesterase n=1 Tax=Vibrio sp. SCSIO 43137 TaxID=3021011 RepID=UPI002306F895|nr:DUF4442 domain-containing protein [Vibrio sp. SCSIO 43137]WCE31076.1 DUF4442 domain-containing protein [Vibrio sp. SCSIO 43137]